MFISSSTPKRRTEAGAACPGPPCRVRQYIASATHRSKLSTQRLQVIIGATTAHTQRKGKGTLGLEKKSNNTGYR